MEAGLCFLAYVTAKADARPCQARRGYLVSDPRGDFFAPLFSGIYKERRQQIHLYHRKRRGRNTVGSFKGWSYDRSKIGTLNIFDGGFSDNQGVQPPNDFLEKSVQPTGPDTAHEAYTASCCSSAFPFATGSEHIELSGREVRRRGRRGLECELKCPREVKYECCYQSA